MSNGTSEFLLKIRTTLEDQGIKLTDEQFEHLQKTAVDANETIHEGHEKLKLDHRELRESVGALGRQFGGLADVGLWLSPLTAALAAVLWSVDKLKEHFGALNDKIREYIETARQIKSDHMEALEAATRRTADAMDEYARQARAAAESQDSENRAIQDRLALNDAYIDGLKRVEEAKERAYEAQIERDEQLGIISKQEAERRKDIARENLQDTNSQLESRKEQQRLAEHQRQIDEAQGRIPQELAARDAALHRAEHPGTTADDLQKEIARQQEILKRQNKAVTDEQAELQEVQTPGTWPNIRVGIEDFGGLGGHQIRDNVIFGKRQSISQAEKVAAATEAYIKSLGNLVQAHERAVKDAHAEADLQNKKLEADVETVRTGQERIKQEKAMSDLRTKADQSVNQWHTQADLTRENRWVSIDPNITAARTDPNASNNAFDAIAKARILESSLFGQTGATADPHSMQELHDVLNRMLGYLQNRTVSASQHNDLAQVVNDVSHRLGQLEAEQHHNRTSP